MNPLPRNTKLLTDEDGWKIVTDDFIGPNSIIGIAFVKGDFQEFRNGLVPTALGAYLGHSVNPNCLLQTNSKVWYLWTIKDVLPHHALTINYNLYF